MRYPVLIEAGDERTAWSVIVPDLPGCFSAADTLDDALTSAEEAALGWIDAALDAGRPIPRPSSPQKAVAEADETTAWILAYICIDPSLLDDTIERVNISLPRHILARLDAHMPNKNSCRRTITIPDVAQSDHKL